ncbi:MAG: acylneuraminate cytidylyltransferase [Croceibacter sp.]|nr:acylneuraminate cytidylyltransferase [Croceibacter sp.]
MRILGIIPARGGSKGVPNKNIKLLESKPLLQYTWEAAKEVKSLHRIIVSTEDDKIISISKTIGIDVPFKRPQHLAEDTSGSLGVVKHALAYFESVGEHYDAICLLQPTTPFITSKVIEACIEKFKDIDTDSLVSVREVPHQFHPNWVFVEDGKNHIKTYKGKTLSKSRQDLSKAYYRDGQVYLTKANVILEKKSLYGNTIGYHISKNSPYINIDTMKDWQEAERLMNDYI